MEDKIEELEKNVADLIKRVTLLEQQKNDSIKKTPKDTAKPIELEEYVEQMEKGHYSCCYYPKTGANQNKFCNKTKSLHFKGEPIDDNFRLDELHPRDFRHFRCKTHVNKAVTEVNDLGNSMIRAHYGKFNDGAVVVKNEEEPGEQIANILSGNTVEVITTPSRAKPKKPTPKVDEKYIEVDDKFLDEPIEYDGKYVIVRHEKSVTGTPKKRPSPVILGVIEVDDFDRNDHLEGLEEPDSNVLKNFEPKKYKPLGEAVTPKKNKTPTVAKIPKINKINIDSYEADTDPEDGDEEKKEDEDIEDLINNLE